MSDDNGKVAPVFEECGNFRIYDLENSKITSKREIKTAGKGYKALTAFLKINRVDVLLCGWMNKEVGNSLMQYNILHIGGLHGDSDKLAERFISGLINTISHAHSHHGEGHGGSGNEDVPEDGEYQDEFYGLVCGGDCGGCPAAGECGHSGSEDGK